jgi:hypothetical protein
MSEADAELTQFEIRSARCLARLFRIECGGGFDRRPVVIIGRLIERRGRLAASLLRTDQERRTRRVRPTAELVRALAELADEVRRALSYAHTRLQQIGKDLRLSQGEGLPTGIRDNGNGRPLGTS